MLNRVSRSFNPLVAVASAVIPAIVLIMPQIALAQAVSFTLINGTSRDLLEFYASPPDEESWEDDILPVVLGPGEEIEVIIDDGRPDCVYDIMGVLGPSDDGSVGEGALIQSAVNICDGDTYEYFEE